MIALSEWGFSEASLAISSDNGNRNRTDLPSMIMNTSPNLDLVGFAFAAEKVIVGRHTHIHFLVPVLQEPLSQHFFLPSSVQSLHSPFGTFSHC